MPHRLKAQRSTESRSPTGTWRLGPEERAIERIRRQQQPDGLWRSLYEGGPVHVSTGLIATNLLDSPSPARFEIETALIEDLLSLQRASGGFEAYDGGPLSRDATRIVSLALSVFLERNATSLASLPTFRGAIETALRRATRWIRWSPWLAPSPFLDFIADLLWDSVYPGRSAELLPNPLAAELTQLFLRSRRTREVRTSLSTFARQALPAIGILVEVASRRSWLGRTADRALDVVIELFGGESSARSLERLESALRANQAKNGGWLWTVFGTALNLLALRALGRDASDPAVAQGLSFIHALRMPGAEGRLKQSWCNAELWDACVASSTLLFCGVEPARLQTDALVALLLAEQAEDGLWAFGVGAVEGDNDSASMVLTYLTRVLAGLEGERRHQVAEAIRRCTQALLSGQQRDDGWGYSPDPHEAPYSFGPRSPFGLETTLIDGSTPDVTGRVLGSLLAARETGVLSARLRREVGASFQRSLRYFQAAQTASGAWQGRWVTGHLSPLPFILPVLQAGGQPLRDPWLRRAHTFVASRQNPDGGWGESPRVDSDPALAGRGASTPAQTAFALSALVACARSRDELRRDALTQSALAHLGATDTWENGRALYTVAYRDDYFDADLMTETMVLTMLRYHALAHEHGPEAASRQLILGTHLEAARARG